MTLHLDLYLFAPKDIEEKIFLKSYINTNSTTIEDELERQSMISFSTIIAIMPGLDLVADFDHFIVMDGAWYSSETACEYGDFKPSESRIRLMNSRIASYRNDGRKNTEVPASLYGVLKDIYIKFGHE